MAMLALLLLLLLLAAAHSATAHCPDDPGCPSTANCTIKYYNQTIGAPAMRRAASAAVPTSALPACPPALARIASVPTSGT